MGFNGYEARHRGTDKEADETQAAVRKKKLKKKLKPGERLTALDHDVLPDDSETR